MWLLFVFYHMYVLHALQLDDSPPGWVFLFPMALVSLTALQAVAIVIYEGLSLDNRIAHLHLGNTLR